MSSSPKKTTSIPLFSIDSAASVTKALTGIRKLPVQDSARVIISGNAELIQKAISSLVKLSQSKIVSVGVSLRGTTKL